MERHDRGRGGQLGNTKRRAPRGLGAYIADATAAGDFPRVALGIAVMSVFVVALNRTLWRPLYGFAERRYAWTERDFAMVTTTLPPTARSIVEERHVKHFYGKAAARTCWCSTTST